MRCISGNPRKEDGESAEVIFQRLHYTSISKFLADASQRRLVMLTACRDTYPGLAEDIQWQKTVYHSYLNPVQNIPSQKPVHPEQRSFQCPQCPRTFDSLHAMRTHCARTHKISFVRPDLQQGTARQEVDIAQHSLHGLPTCRHCGFVFRKWSGFKGHILSACPVLHARTVAPAAITTEDTVLAETVPGSAEQSAAGPAPNTVLSASASLSPKPPQDEAPNEIPANPSPMQISTLEQGPDSTTATALTPPEPPPPEPPALPLSRQVEVLQTCQTGWVDFAESHGEQLKYYCVICGQWCAPAAGGLKSHMRRSHPTQWTMDKDIMNELKLHHRLKYRGVCKACGFQPTGAQKGAPTHRSALHITKPAYCTSSAQTHPATGPRMATSGQQEVLELFGKHLPSVAAQATTQEEKRLEDSRPRKWPKPEGKGGRPASRATRSNRGWSNNWSHWDGNDQAKLTDQVSGEDVRNLLALVTRLSLRQEDDLAATRADNAFLFYLETRTTGIYRPIPSFAGN